MSYYFVKDRAGQGPPSGSTVPKKKKNKRHSKSLKIYVIWP